jgi:dTMP kinase
MFITFEGIDGAGKTTQIVRTASYLQKRGKNCITTREPGGTPMGQDIWDILRDPDNKNMNLQAELLLYMADRVLHVNEVIRPALDAGQVVICDRYHDSMLAYQGFAKGTDIGIVNDLYQLIIGEFKPDLTFLLDLPPAMAMARKQDEHQTKLSLLEKAHAGYIALALSEPERIRIIDASMASEDVHHHIIDHIENFQIELAEKKND